MTEACLVDTTKCIGCRACQVACKQWNELPAEETSFRVAGGDGENPPALSSKTYTRITFHEILDSDGALDHPVFVKRQCMHCGEPACVSACPVAALEKVRVGGESAGPVIYHADKCIGCRYCMTACPFNIPKLEWDKPVARIMKCTFCADRAETIQAADARVNGTPLAGASLKRFHEGQRAPACAKVCPTGAIQFGERDALIAEARRRIAERPNRADSWRYVDHVYGENEVGGTNWLYLANVPFDKIGFRTDLGTRPYPEYTRIALDAVPPAVMGVGAVLGGIYWISNRRNDVCEAGPSGDVSAGE